ncbi:MAG TPA: NADH-quinone oxidoreductase subunit L [Vicinamibacterales bacterium]|nr:NADH-quinone oxidoreductase subunit L [Vicinamibacterales bacterium]
MSILVVFLPLAAAIIAGLFGRWLGDRGAQLVTTGALLISAALACFVFYDVAIHRHGGVVDLFTWIDTGELQIRWALRLDTLSAVMLLVVTIVSSMVHVYSIGYMAHDHSIPRFMAYLSFFTFFMLMLVTADNFIQMFFGWEGVGLCSYLLIGFWYQKKAASDAGKKAFIVNRIGDFGFVLGVLLLFVRFGTVDFQEVARAAAAVSPEAAFGTVSWITLLLFIGATGKSAQIPLYIWLPDAMEGPTPVSALIHAATMVTAGVYMIGRNAVLFSHAPQTLAIVAVIGAATALMAGTIGLVQNDIKRVLAYSTVSQLGYMFLAMGVGAYAAGIFHLYTHAFFKALLFLGSGAVIHALAGEQDLRKMGGLKKDLPITYWTFLIGALAIAGVPGLAGFFSKDEILYRTYTSGHTLLWVIGLLTALLTAIYMFRLVFMAFHGESRRAAASHEASIHDAPHHSPSHLHDAPPAMAVALIVLAIGSVVAGYAGLPSILGGGDWFARYLEPSFGVAPVEEVAEHGLEGVLMLVSIAVAAAGIGIAWYFFLKNRRAADEMAGRFGGLQTLLLNKYYVDEIYDATIVQPIRIASEDGLWKVIDVRFIDAAVNGVGLTVAGASERLRRVQTGSVRSYAASVFLGVVVILGYYLWR